MASLVFFCAVWEEILKPYSVVTRDEPRPTIINTETEVTVNESETTTSSATTGEGRSLSVSLGF